MHNGFTPKTRINLLLISFEALDMYAQDKTTLNSNIFLYYLKQILFYLQYNKNIRSHSLHSQLDSTQNMYFIYDMYILSMHAYAQKMTQKILCDYYQKRESHIIIKYLHRFNYIYNQTQNLYNNKSYYGYLKIRRIAIMNLYIINQVGKKNNLYYLIKYLYN